MSIQKPIEACPRRSTDPRTVAAWELYEMFPSGHLNVFKTTRAGATTSLNAESGNRGERFTCLVPTNKIADETIVRDSIEYCENPELDVIHIKSNMHCIKNVELCEKYPDLKQLPFIPLADKCEDCEHYKVCPITAPLRRPNADGFVLTYHKVVALQLSALFREKTTAEQILKSISGSRNIIVDEVHELQYGKKVDYAVYDSKNGRRVNLDIYASACQDFKYIRSIIEDMRTISDDAGFKVKVHEVYGAAQDAAYWKHHLSLNYANPAYKNQERGATGRQTAGIVKEIIELTKRKKDYNLSMDAIKALYSFMAIGKSLQLSINAIKEKGIIKINVSAIDFLFTDMIRSFTMSMQGQGRRTFLTTATFCSEDFSKFFMGNVKPTFVLFGKNGDPKNNNSKMLILADNKKYNAVGDRSRHKMKGEIVSRILEILDLYAGEEVQIITLNIDEALKLEEALEKAGRAHRVDYYKSSDTIGVTSDARIIIAVGIANKPVNAFDVLTRNSEESRKMLFEAVHCDTWQALSRVKDPDGKEPSLVFGLGCCVDDLRACIEWGFNRTITGIEEHKNGCRNKVSIEVTGGNITKPEVIHCKTFENMKEQAIMFKQSKNQSVSDTKPSIYYILDGSCSKTSVFLDSPLEMLKLMCNRRDTYGLQEKDGTYKRSKFPLTDRDLMSHISGEKTIGTYQLNKEHQVSWIAFDVDSHAPKVKDPETGKRVPKTDETKEEIDKRNNIAEENKSRLFNALNSLHIPFTLEASGSPFSYHFLVFLSVPIPASVAVFAGEEIKKIAGIVGDIELFPKQTKLTQKEFGNLLKMPFATHRKTGLKSKIMINGDFQETFSGLEIQTIDLSPLAELQQEKKEEVKEKVKTAKKKFKAANPNFKPMKDGFIRPCFISSQMLQMNHGDGNQFRIAAAGELYRAGYSLDEAVQYFKYQDDFDEEETRYRLSMVFENNYHRTEQEKLKRLCTRFVNCENCGYDGICDYISRV